MAKNDDLQTWRPFAMLTLKVFSLDRRIYVIILICYSLQNFIKI